MPKDKVKGSPAVTLAKSTTRTPVRAINAALSAGFGGGIVPGLVPQWNLTPQDQLSSRPFMPTKKKGRR
jgi:hypothetical protein